MTNDYPYWAGRAEFGGYESPDWEALAECAEYEAPTGERQFGQTPRALEAPPPVVRGAAAERLRMRRTWEPLAPRWQEPNHASLGIGIVTYQRLPQLRWLIDALVAFTHSPFHLVIADDGSTDGTSAWARESGIPVVTGRHRGMPWNKNRALYWLLHRTRCEQVVLLEDAISPVRDGWERDWIAALEQFEHLCHAPESMRPNWGTQVATYAGYPAYDWTAGLAMGFTRPALQQVGFFDTRLQGTAGEHLEYTERFRRAGFHPPRGYVTLPDGCLCEPPRPARNAEPAERLLREHALHRELADEPVWRPPSRTSRETLTLAHEQRRAEWPHRAGREEGREVVSVLCASRNETLARRLAASFGNDPHLEFIWAWNGEGRPELPGRLVEYPERPFNYCEAINWAARYATGRVLLVVNDDVELTCRGLPKFLLDLYRERPDLGVAYGGIPGDWTTYSAPYAPHWQGCCWAISRGAFEAIGGLEESLAGYGADEFITTVRMLRLGYEGVRVRGWTYHHEAHLTYGHVPDLHYNRREVPAALGWSPAPGLADIELGWNGPLIHQAIIAGEGRPDLVNAWLPDSFRSAALTEAPGRKPIPHPAPGPIGSHYLPAVACPPPAPGHEHVPGSHPYAPPRTVPPSRPHPQPSRPPHPGSGGRPQTLRWQEPQRASLGIGIISYNRLPQVIACVEALLSLTHTPFHLVLADDASSDGTAEWAREHGIPVVTGRNRGIAWNKNRALHWLIQHTSCRKLILIEDDTRPVRGGWERGWLDALDRFGHVCYSPEGARIPESIVALHHGYIALDWVGGALMAMTRETVEQVGYLDTRFLGYGDEHIEYSERCQRAGLYSAPGFVTLRDGSLCPHPPIQGNPQRITELLRNRAIRGQLHAEPVYRPPARDENEHATLAAELAAALARVPGQNGTSP